MRLSMIMAAVAATGVASTAFGAYSVTQSNAQNQVAGNLITFDDGAPLGIVDDPYDYYGDLGITFTSGNGFLMANDWDGLEGIAGGAYTGGNMLNGGFSIRMVFSQDISELDWRGWANGSPAPPFGGINVFLFNDGAQVAAYSGISPQFGAGDEWFHASSDGGDVFDEVRFFGGAFNAFNTYADSISFAAIPAPGALALFGLAGLAGRRRRSN